MTIDEQYQYSIAMYRDGNREAAIKFDNMETLKRGTLNKNSVFRFARTFNGNIIKKFEISLDSDEKSQIEDIWKHLIEMGNNIERIILTHD